MNRINEKVAAWLMLEGNSMGKLADELGINRATLRLKLRGQNDWTWSQAIALADIIGCTPNELAGVTNER